MRTKIKKDSTNILKKYTLFYIDKIMGKQYKCCGGLRLDTSKYVCCGEEKITKITGYENKCCLVNGYIELYDVSKQTCTQKGVVTRYVNI